MTRAYTLLRSKVAGRFSSRPVAPTAGAITAIVSPGWRRIAS
jgi:hypothetical protein